MSGGLVERRAARRPAAPVVADRSMSKVPKYYGLKQELGKELALLAPGAALPSERELAARFSTSRTTVRQALHELVVEGRLVRVHGSGSFAARPKLAQPLQLTSYTEETEAQGLTPSSQLLAVGYLRADALLAARLAIGIGGRVLCIERLRLANGEPMAIETTHLAASRFPRLRAHVERLGSLYRALDEVYGVALERAEQVIETVPARPEEAALLGVEPGLPLLLVLQRSFDADGSPIEWARSVFRGDRYTFVTEVRRPGGNDREGAERRVTRR